MEENQVSDGGGGGAVSAIATAIGAIFSFFGARQQEDNIQNAQLPPWLTFSDFKQEKDNTGLFIIIALIIAIIIVSFLKRK